MHVTTRYSVNGKGGVRHDHRISYSVMHELFVSDEVGVHVSLWTLVKLIIFIRVIHVIFLRIDLHCTQKTSSYSASPNFVSFFGA